MGVPDRASILQDWTHHTFISCPKCDFFNFSDSFFADQLNLENEKRFDPLANGSGTKATQTGSDKNKFINGLKFVRAKIKNETLCPN